MPMMIIMTSTINILLQLQQLNKKHSSNHNNNMMNKNKHPAINMLQQYASAIIAINAIKGIYSSAECNCM